jgi:hypothetical protein
MCRIAALFLTTVLSLALGASAKPCPVSNGSFDFVIIPQTR